VLEVSVPIAHELLAQCVKQGQALIQRASLVGDFSDYEAWKAARKQWIDPTVHALEHMYDGPREAREFREAVACAESGRRWQEQYAADLECVKAAIELLSVMQGELAFDARAAGELAQGADALVAGGQSFEQPAQPLQEDRGEVHVQLEPERRGEDAINVRAADSLLREPAEPPLQVADAPRAVGAELARAPLVGAELAQQEEPGSPAERGEAPVAAPTPTRRVFVAHGRDERWKVAVAHLLEQAGSDEVTILNDHPEERARLLERIGEEPHGARYAIVLLTADDIGAARLESTEEPYFTTRASQGVVFEMGFLVAALTRGQVCVLYEDGVELPCELDGISHVRLDLAGTWQPKLLLALRRAGFDYDLNRLAAA
jgi:predicted nucleotide-binding protein